MFPGVALLVVVLYNIYIISMMIVSISMALNIVDASLESDEKYT